MMKKTGAAFTLIELLIVVAIIAVLAAIAVPNFLEAQMRAKVSRTLADMRTVVIGMEAYHVENNWIPWEGSGGGTIEFLRWKDYQTGRLMGIGRRLTTPVAFLTSVPVDYFNTRMFELEKPHNNPHRVIWASFFMRGATVPGREAPNVSFVWYNDDLTNARAHTYRYMLQSVGPDFIPWPQNSWTPYYNPTNGTVSIGDIFYIDSLGYRGEDR